MNVVKNITIHWVRHAESCANYDQGTINDNIPKNYSKSCGYEPKEEKILQQTKQKKKLLDPSSLTAPFRYEPNLSFIGMQHSIMLGNNFIDSEIKNKKYDMIFVSPLTRTIMTSLVALRHHPNVKIYVVPFTSEHLNLMGKVNSDFQNTPVKSYTLKKKIIFVKDWLENSWLDYFDDIEVIEILTDIKNKLIDDPNKNSLYNDVVSALEHKPMLYTKNNKCSRKIFNDIVSKKYIVSKTKEIIIKLNSNLNNFDNNIQIKIKRLINLLDPNIIRGPEVDFSILEYFENQNKNIGSNFDKFYTEVIPYVNAKYNLSNDSKLLCVSHGSTMKKYFNKTYKLEKDLKIKDLANTQVLEELIKIIQKNDIINDTASLTFDIIHSSINPTKYIPLSIRNSFQNFEDLNYDVCRRESLKGFLNYYMTKKFEKNHKNISGKVPNDDKLLVPVTQKQTSRSNGLTSKDYATPDVKFYYDKKWEDYIPKNILEIKGGYYNKYLKYKQKYLLLKNQLY